MRTIQQDRRLLIAGGCAAAGFAIALAGTAMLWGALLYRGDVYPGARRVSAHTTYRLAPSLYIRRDTSYRTDDLFPAVYQWYSIRYATGPEVRATGRCNDLEESSVWFVFRRDVNITLCDSDEGRMMFVMRALYVRRAQPRGALPGP